MYISIHVVSGVCGAAAGGSDESDPDRPGHHRLPAAQEVQVTMTTGLCRTPPLSLSTCSSSPPSPSLHPAAAT